MYDSFSVAQWHSLVLTTVIADYEPGDQPHQLAFLMWEASFFKEKFGSAERSPRKQKPSYQINPLGRFAGMASPNEPFSIRPHTHTHPHFQFL
jgi:hypothetical protein